ncbi:MAG: YajQ family cyclic di-GMP-binding protein [Alphaproteobacteria bacterium]|nr:YajQ family cyclic di-GMP-binding protein [Alphaproteobacteria bacterium]TAD90583.1 MAG: YajQ family cyclic di-GMP-binding protein [Alphaproteobacteria bacterium]
MPSFDIVSKTDLAEVDNALGNLSREIATRFDFKGTKCSVERKDEVMTIQADDDTRLKTVQELLRAHLTRRKLDIGCLDMKPPEKATGNSLRQTVVIKQGIETELAKKIVKALKDSKIKVQAAIQGDELRVSGKNRDDLQTAIRHVKGLGIEQPLQFTNFRD